MKCEHNQVKRVEVSVNDSYSHEYWECKTCETKFIPADTTPPKEKFHRPCCKDCGREYKFDNQKLLYLPCSCHKEKPEECDECASLNVPEIGPAQSEVNQYGPRKCPKHVCEPSKEKCELPAPPKYKIPPEYIEEYLKEFGEPKTEERNYYSREESAALEEKVDALWELVKAIQKKLKLK